MYTIVSTLQYASNEWGYVEIGELTINDALVNSLSLVLTLTDSSGNFYKLDSSDLELVPNKHLTINSYISSLTTSLTKITKEVELVSSSYKDLTGVNRVGNNYFLEENYPFIITPVGIRPVNDKMVEDIHYALAGVGNFTLGALAVDLDYSVSRYLKTEIRSTFKLAKKFNLNNTLLIFGNSILLASSVLRDLGDCYTLKSGYAKWLLDLYMDNVDIITPNTIGLNPHTIEKVDVTDINTLKLMFSHNKVYFVEYQHDYPLGNTNYYVSNEFIDNYYDSLIMSGNKPTQDKVLHLRDKYVVRDVIAKTRVTHHDDSSFNILASNELEVSHKAPILFNLDWPTYTLV